MSDIILPTNDIIQYWFGDTPPTETRSLWYDQSPDSYLTTTYKYLVDMITIDNYKKFVSSTMDQMALLLIGDQFTRNIYRNTEERTKNDLWALELALYMIQQGIDLTLPLHYRYFILLPLRHNKSSTLLDIVYRRIKFYKYEHDCPSLRKFYTHTIKNYTDLTDEIVYCDPSIEHEKKDEFKKVLEKPPMIPDWIQSSVVEAISKFTTPFKRVAVSLSGGVDSMVVLDTLQRSGRFEKMVAIHVEYVNRKEAYIEREFLEYYCASKRIPLYYRTIRYMKRNDDMVDRSVFEEETKKARFNLYKYVIDKEQLDGVCLGHHMGDIVENIITNMIKGKDVANIKGMSEKQSMYQVTLYRPFLSLTKENIIDYAHYHRIPYFLNTTPEWSCRGVLRDKVIPDLLNQFGHFEQNMIAFAERCSYLETFYQEEIKKRLEEKKSDYSTRIIYCKEMIDTLDSIVMRFMHGNGYNMASKNSILNMKYWLQGTKHNQLQISKDVFCFYLNGYVYLVNETRIRNESPDMYLLKTQLGDYLPRKLLDM